MLFPFNPVEAECAPPGTTQTSGFVDEEKGCPITIESYERVSDEASRFKIERVGGLALTVGGLGVGVVGAVRKKPTQP